MKRRRARRPFSRSYFGGVKLLVLTVATGAFIQWLYTDPPQPISPLAEAAEVAPVSTLSPSPSPTLTPTPKPAPTVPQIVDGIHLLESSRGKAKVGLQAYCAAQGLSNEYGYGGMDGKICFRNHVEAKARVTLWVVEHMEKYHGHVGQTLCRYANGGDAKNCEYYQNFLRRVK